MPNLLAPNHLVRPMSQGLSLWKDLQLVLVPLLDNVSICDGHLITLDLSYYERGRVERGLGGGFSLF